MKKYIKWMVGALIVAELILIGSDTYIYLSKGFCKHNINGRIIATVDNLINFSGWAE